MTPGLRAFNEIMNRSRRRRRVDAAVRAWMYAPDENRVGAAREMLDCDNPRCATCRIWRLNILQRWEMQQ